MKEIMDAMEYHNRVMVQENRSVLRPFPVDEIPKLMNGADSVIYMAFFRIMAEAAKMHKQNAAIIQQLKLEKNE